MTIDINAALDYAFEKLENIESEIKARLNDMTYNIVTEKTAHRLKEEIELLQEKKEIAEEDIKSLQIFIANALMIKNQTRYSNIINEPCFSYFNRTLKRYEFEYGPKNSMCEFCGKTQTRRTGIVQTIDPMSLGLAHICTDCYIDHLRNKETVKIHEN